MDYRTVRSLYVLAVAVIGANCRASTAESRPASRQQVSSSDSVGRVLATIGDEKVTLATVRVGAGETLDELEGQYRQARDKIIAVTLDSILRERLISDEAKRQGKTVTDLITGVFASAGDPSEAEIADWYKDNQIRIGGQSLDQVRPQIVGLLQRQRRADALEKLEQRLRSERRVVVTFEPERFHFNNDGAPALGKLDAPVVLVEFSDFQCPYCQATAPTLKEVRRKFGDQVRIVYRQFPLTSIHPYALKAAEASLCASEQAKFWELHDAMFADQTKLTVTDLKETARRLGMNAMKFGSCLDSDQFAAQVQADQREGKRLGINGTPALFINGTYVEGGAVPFSALAHLIGRELARKGVVR